jgi:two-component system, NtrC family, sensor histidine kinase HydH
LFKGTPPELADQREQLLAELRKGEQQKAVATLAAGLAHEIKNPLASIKTFTEHLAARQQDPIFLAKFQKIVGGEVKRINLIVQRLLEFAKPTPPQLTPLGVPRLLDETLEFLNNELVQRHVEVQRRYEASPRILGDPQQLKQVFLNLFLNSLQAMNGQGRLTIQTARSGSELVVTITDNGPGIAPTDLPHVFEPFYTTKPTGTGLGLAVVQGIVKEHGGRIDVASQPGQGTKIRLCLPITT